MYIPNQKYKVQVRCLTYNQKKYIKDALNGFAMQQTNFPFVCVVMDDCSTDGEQEVINSWIERMCDMRRAETINLEITDIVVVPHKLNCNCIFAIYLLKQNLHGKAIKKEMLDIWDSNCEYRAMCEGDDYWVDSQKLQKQVDFLDTHKDYAMCYTKCKRYDQVKGMYVDEAWGGSNEKFEEFIESNTVPTLTSMFRIREASRYYVDVNPTVRKWRMGDYPMWLYMSHESKVKFLDFVSGVYRITDNSASHFDNQAQYESFIESSIDIVLFFVSLFNYPLDIEKYKRIRITRMASNIAFLYGDRSRAVEIVNSLDKKRISDFVKIILFKSKLLFNLYKKTLAR